MIQFLIDMYMKQIFLSMISQDILNSFVFQLLYCFFETCLIFSPARYKRILWDFARAVCACFLIISVFILMSYLNIACLLFKYFDLCWSFFFLIGIHSMQGWTATKRNGVTSKRSTKRLKPTGNLFRKNLQLIGFC